MNNEELQIQLLYQKCAAVRRAKLRERSSAAINADEDQGDTHEGLVRDEVLSPAFLALMNEHYDVAEWLIKAEERRFLADKQYDAIRAMKTSLIHLAAMLDKPHLVRLLITGPYPAEINSRDDEGNTALHLAYQVGNTEAAQYLEEAGCNQELLNDKGLRAIDLKVDNEEREEDGEYDGEDSDSLIEAEDDDSHAEGEDDDATLHECETAQSPTDNDDFCESDDEEDDFVAARSTESGTILGAPPPAPLDEEMMGECYIENLPAEVILRVSFPPYSRHKFHLQEYV